MARGKHNKTLMRDAFEQMKITNRDHPLLPVVLRVFERQEKREARRKKYAKRK